MTLYELKGAWLSVMDMVEDDTDIQAIQDTIDSIDAAIDEKAENYGKVIKNIMGDIAIIKKEEKRFSEKRKALENKAKALQDRLFEAMNATHKEKIKTPLFTFTIQNNPEFAAIEDEAAFRAWAQKEAPQYLNVEEPKINRTLLKDDLKAGKKIKGVKLDRTRGLRIR